MEADGMIKSVEFVDYICEDGNLIIIFDGVPNDAYLTYHSGNHIEGINNRAKTVRNTIVTTALKELLEGKPYTLSIKWSDGEKILWNPCPF